MDEPQMELKNCSDFAVKFQFVKRKSDVLLYEYGLSYSQCPNLIVGFIKGFLVMFGESQL